MYTSERSANEFDLNESLIQFAIIVDATGWKPNRAFRGNISLHVPQFEPARRRNHPRDFAAFKRWLQVSTPNG